MEISLAQYSHPDMLIESYSRIASVHIELDPDRKFTGARAYEICCSIEKQASKTCSLRGWKYIDLLQMKDLGTILVNTVRLN